jgi:hypothetical protein
VREAVREREAVFERQCAESTGQRAQGRELSEIRFKKKMAESREQ